MSVKRVSSFRPPFGRAVSVGADDRSVKSKSATPSLIGRWRSFRSKTVSATVHEDRDRRPSPLAAAVAATGVKTPTEPVDYPSSDSLFDESGEGLGDELSVKVCKDSIRRSIVDHVRIAGGDVKLLSDIEAGDASAAVEAARSLGRPERNMLLLWCAFVKRHDLLDRLLEAGVDLDYTLISEGLSAIHLSAFSGCVRSVRWLLEKGCDPDAKPAEHTPLDCAVWGNSPETVRLLLDRGASVAGTAVHYAVRANAVECLRMLVDVGADVNARDACGVVPLHLAADRGMIACVKLLLERKADVNAATRDRLMTPLHYAAEGGYVDCVAALLGEGAEPDRRNKKGQTPLHLAARSQSVECMDALLRAGASVDERDADSRTPLHAAVGKALLAFESVEMLLRRGADVNIRDRYGYTPLHVAALNELVQCVDALITRGADVSSRTKGGVSALSIVARKTPNCLVTVRKKLDASVSLHDPETTTREVYLKLDFRYLLQHSSGGEVGLLKTLIDEGQKDMLEHPLCGAFLYTKWSKIRRFYLCRLLLSGVFVLLLTGYVLTALAHHCYNATKADAEAEAEANGTRFASDRQMCLNHSAAGTLLVDNPHAMSALWYALGAFALCETARKIMSLASYSTLKFYFFHPGNVFEWFSIVSVFVISFRLTGATHVWQNHVAAFAVLFGWANLMLMIGQLPVFGTYVAMFTKVLKEFFKLLAAYVCALVGFTVAFCVIFPTFAAFQNPLYGIVKVLVMMTGELDMDMLKDSPLHVTSYAVYALFVLFVAVVLMNLVVGIAVHDIQGLHKTAGLSKLVRQTELISFLELALFQGYLPRRVVGLLKRSALISPAVYRVVLHVKPLNPREKRLPKHIMAAAYDIARENVKNRDCRSPAAPPSATIQATTTASTSLEEAIARLDQRMARHDQALAEILDAIRNHLLLHPHPQPQPQSTMTG